MKIKLVINLDDRMRKAIAFRYGKKKAAGYKSCKDHLLLALDGDLDDVGNDYDLGMDGHEEANWKKACRS